MIRYREIRKTAKTKVKICKFFCLKVLLSMYCVCFLERKGRVGIYFYRSRRVSFNILN